MSRKSDKIRKDIKYLNKDFGEVREELISFTKNYYPQTYNDFNEASPGLMFIELVSAASDILSYYTDVQLRESLLTSVEEKINLFNIAHSLGFKPKFRTPASVDLDLFQLLPAAGTGGTTYPDFRYALQIDSGLKVQTNEGTEFRTLDSVDFNYSSSFDNTEISVYSLDDTGEVEYFLLKKSVRALSGTIVSRDYTFGSPKPYDKVVLPETNVLEVVDIYDSEGNQWYETPYLAQDLVPIAIPNLPYNDPYLANYRSSAPYLLRFKQTEHRFVTRYRKDELVEIQFGSGVGSELDEELVPNPLNVGIGLNYFERAVDLSIDPSNFLYTRTYGKAPSSTTLTIRYTTGGGIADNVGANEIRTITSSSITTPLGSLDNTVFQTITESIAVNNPMPACGGLYENNVESIRLNAMATFAAQNRAVTREDYIVRAYSMPVKFGAIAKAYVEPNQFLNLSTSTVDINQLALDFYILGYDENRNFTGLNAAIKFNLQNYLKQYRIMTDAINIKEAFVINIGIEFEIIIDETYNGNEVLLRCIDALKSYFDNSNMQIGQSIFKNTVLKEIALQEGVLSVASLSIYNLCDRSLGYSGNAYNIDNATRKNVIYPSLDPSIFEVKFPNRDIKGRVVNY